ncbi:MAG: hypothetical protein WBA09_20765 [Candidatus Acidiferrum sp.]
MHTQHLAKDLLSDPVGQIAKGVQRFLRTAARFKLLPDALSFVLGLWSEYGQGS